MNDQDPSASSENRLSETESSLTLRGLSSGAGGARLGGERETRQKTGEPKPVKIVLRIEAVESQLASVAQPTVETPETSNAVNKSSFSAFVSTKSIFATTPNRSDPIWTERE
jgi:hypothetical protein